MPKSKLAGMVRNKTGALIQGVQCDVGIYQLSDHTIRLSAAKSDMVSGAWGCSVPTASGEKVLAVFSHKGIINNGDVNVAGAEFMETTITVTTSSSSTSTTSSTTTSTV